MTGTGNVNATINRKGANYILLGIALALLLIGASTAVSMAKDTDKETSVETHKVEDPKSVEAGVKTKESSVNPRETVSADVTVDDKVSTRISTGAMEIPLTDPRILSVDISTNNLDIIVGTLETTLKDGRYFLDFVGNGAPIEVKDGRAEFFVNMRIEDINQLVRNGYEYKIDLKYI